jgi:hypothetical protein
METQTESMAEKMSNDWPPESALILSALEMAGGNDERRHMRRFSYRVKALLRLLSDTEQAEEKLLYTRDVNARSLGFLTQSCLPLGYGGIVHLPTPAPGNQVVSISCTLLRCREVAPGWFDGALYFNRERNEFTLGEVE